MIRKFAITALVLAFVLLVFAPSGRVATASASMCNSGEPGPMGCMCFCGQWADDHEYDDQFGTMEWKRLWILCLDLQEAGGSCGYDNLSGDGDMFSQRERNMQKLQFSRNESKPEPKPQPLRRNP